MSESHSLNYQAHKTSKLLHIRNSIQTTKTSIHTQDAKNQKNIIKTKNNHQNFMKKTQQAQKNTQQHLAVVKYVNLEDINLLIRTFAYNIQQRFQQFDDCSNRTGSSYSFGVSQPNKISNNKDSQTVENLQYFHRKFNNYTTEDSTQIKYLQKMIIRIQQITDFFKQRSKNGHLLDVFIKKFQSKLNKMVENPPINVELILNHVIQLSENGFNNLRSRVPVLTIKQRRYSQKKVDVTHNQDKSQILQKQNHICQVTAPKKSGSRPISLSAKRKRTQSKQASTVIVCPSTLQKNFNQLYSIMPDIDINHLIKLVSTHARYQRLDTHSLMQKPQKPSKRLQKDLLKQNTTIQQSIRTYQKAFIKKKRKTEQSNPLKQIKNRQFMSLKYSQYNQMNTKNSLVPKIKKQNEDETIKFNSNTDIADFAHKNIICNYNMNNWMARKSRLIGHDLKKKKKFIEIQNLQE